MSLENSFGVITPHVDFELFLNNKHIFHNLLQRLVTSTISLENQNTGHDTVHYKLSSLLSLAQGVEFLK